MPAVLTKSANLPVVLVRLLPMWKVARPGFNSTAGFLSLVLSCAAMGSSMAKQHVSAADTISPQCFMVPVLSRWMFLRRCDAGMKSHDLTAAFADGGLWTRP